MHYNIIKTAAGARTRLRLPMLWKADAVAAEELPEAVFWVFIGGERVRVEKTPGSDDEYIFPALQAGQYAWDLVVDAQMVLHGVLKVRGSAVPPGGGEVCGTLLVDAPAMVLVLSPGPRGEVGPVGPQGLSAYEVALQHGYEGSEDDWAEELSGAQAAATKAKEQATEAGKQAKAAAASATTACEKATAAENAAKAAADSATDAGKQASAAADSAKAAASSATTAGAQASAAEGSAKAAAGSATTAGKQASAAADSAKAAAGSATTASEKATAAANSAKAADSSATTASEQATAAANSATAADSSATTASEQATAAANSATAAADTLAAAPKLNGNNSYSGTNTFNGMLSANGGITGLPQPSKDTAAMSRDAAYMADIYMQTRSVNAVPELVITNGAGTVTESGTGILSETAGLTAAKADNFNGRTFFPVGNYHNIAAGYVNLSKVRLKYSSAFRLTLNLAATGATYYQSDNLNIPALKWRDLTKDKIFQYAYIEITVKVHAGTLVNNIRDNGADVTLRGLNTELKEAGGQELKATGMRECKCSIPMSSSHPITGVFNAQGIIGVFFACYNNRYRVFLVPDAGLTKPIFIGEVFGKSELVSANPKQLQIVADNADVTCDDITLWRGSISDVSIGALDATTPSDLSTIDYTFEDLAEIYPET